MTAHWLKHIERLDGAFSDHTLRSYRSDFGLFAAWCRKRRVPFLPATSETVAAYVETERVRLKSGTLKQRLAAIRKLHLLAGAGDPTRDAEVDLAMPRASRAQPSPVIGPRNLRLISGLSDCHRPFGSHTFVAKLSETVYELGRAGV